MATKQTSRGTAPLSYSSLTISMCYSLQVLTSVTSHWPVKLTSVRCFHHASYAVKSTFFFFFFSTACLFASHSGISCIGANLSTSFDSDHVGRAHINYAWKPNENWHQWASKLTVLRGTRNKNKWNADVLFQRSCAALIYQPSWNNLVLSADIPSFMKQLSEKKKQRRKRVNAYVTV